MTYSRRHTDLSLLIALIIIGAIYCIFSYLTPFQYDDYAFLGGYLAYSDGDTAFDWRHFGNMCLEIRNFDNGRLANILDLFVVLCVPTWLFAICTGAVTAGLFLYLTRFVRELGSRMSAFAILTMIWAVSMVAFPWRNNILVPDYALNYLYSTFLTLWFLSCANKCQKSEILNRRQLVGYCILALVAGAFHEGFSAPVMAGMAAYALSRRCQMRRSWWTVTVAYAIGTAFVCSAPGIWLRAGRELAAGHQASWISAMVMTLPLAVGAVIALASVAIIPSWRHRFHHLWQSQIYVVSAVAMAISMLLWLMLTPNPRNGWFAEVLAVIVLFPIILSWLSDKESHCRWIRPASIGIFAATCVLMGAVLKWQYFFYQQDREIHSLIESSTDGTVYYDVFPPETLPKYVLFQPIQATWIHSFQIVSINNCDRSGRLISVVPTALRDFRRSAAAAINETPGLYAYDNIILSTDSLHRATASATNGQRNAMGRMELTTSSGERHSVMIEGFRFVTAEGDTLYYLRHTLPTLSDKIIRARWED